VELSDHPEEYVKPNWELWNSLEPTYRDPSNGLRIFSVEKLCTVEENSVMEIRN
jgi:hypothetical protein